MITAEIKINGVLVAHIYVVNEDENHTCEECHYRYEYYEPDGKLQRGSFNHVRDAGLASLINRVCEDVEKRKKYQCHVCYRRFTTLSEANKHIKKKHPNRGLLGAFGRERRKK